MWSHLPLGFVLASLFLCCGCLLAAWIRLRDSREEAERLGHDFDLKNRELDDAYLRLEGRVEDLAGRLAQSTAERRQLSVANQRLSAENRALAGGQRGAQVPIAALEPEAVGEIAPGPMAPMESGESWESRGPEAWPASELEAPQATVFDQVMETVLALAEEPLEFPPAPLPAPEEPAREEEVVSAQGDEETMAAWNENLQHPPIPETGPSFTGYTGGAGALDAMDAEPPALRSEREPDPWQRHLAAVESLRDATVHQGAQLEAVARRCAELEQMIVRIAERIPERPEPAPAPTLAPEPAAPSDWAIRQTELEGRAAVLDADLRRKTEICGTLEARLTSRDEELRHKTEACESLEAELVSGRRKIESAERHLEESDRRIEELEEGHRLTAARASDLEAQAAKSDEELSRKVAECEAAQAELATTRRRAEAAERLLEDLQQRIAQQNQDGEERLRREQAEHQATASRADDLEVRLASRDEDLRQRAGMIELLQGEVVAKNRQIEAAGERCADLEQRLQLASQEDSHRMRREQELHNGWTARAAELESHLSRRDEDLRQRSATIERLEREAEGKNRQIEAAEQRGTDLERELEQRRTEFARELEQRRTEFDRELARREEREQERVRHEQSLQQTLSTRVVELEARLASLGEDLAQRVSSIQNLEQDLGSKGERAQEAAERCAELERELHQRAEREHVRRAQEESLEQERLLRMGDLERDLATRDEELRRLRDERAQLADGCRELSERLDSRARDLHLQEQHLGEVQTRAEASEATARRRTEDVQAGDVLIDELLENRLTALFKRRASQASEPLSELYLDGLEQGDFDHAMQALLGDPEPLGEASLARLGARWRREHETWRSAPLEREVLYLWADGIRLRAGLEKPEEALLAVVASHADGSRSVVAVESGDPASKDAWLSVLRSLVQRGMNVPRLVVAPGASGLWVAMDELGWDCARQYCWSHETDEVLSGLPKKRRSQADKILRAAASADTRAAAKKLRDRFVKRCGVRCASAGQRLSADWKQLTSFYAFPEDHWRELQTTQVVASPLEAIRLSAALRGEPKPGKPSPNVEAVLWRVLGASCRSLKKLSGLELLPPAAAGSEPAATPKGRSRSRAA